MVVPVVAADLILCLPGARFTFSSSVFAAKAGRRFILRRDAAPTVDRARSMADNLKESLKEYVPEPSASANAPLPPSTTTAALIRLTGIQVGVD